MKTSENLRKPQIAESIAEAQEARSERTENLLKLKVAAGIGGREKGEEIKPDAA